MMGKEDKNLLTLMKIRSMGYKGLMENLEMFIVDLMNQNERLQLKLDNYNKDEEIQKLKNELDNLRNNSLYNMSEKEKQSVKVFVEEHASLCRGAVQYQVIGSGIGYTLNVHCLKCKVSKAVTDYSQW